MSILVADMNHNNTVDFDRIAKAGIGGVIHKATQGVGFTDNKYTSRRLLCEAAGVEWGGYDFNVSDNVKDDVDKFFAVAQPTARTLMMLDFERNPAADMTLGQALEFLDRGDQKLGRRLTFYGGDKIKSAIVHATDTQRDFLAAHPYMLCEYGPTAKMVDVNGHPLPWKQPDLWQKWADHFGPNPPMIDGLEDDADLSIFQGDRAALAAWWPGPAIPAPAVA